MLKTLSPESAEPKKGVVGVSTNSKARPDKGELNKSEIDDIEFDGGKVGDNEVGKKGRKMSKNLSKSKKMIGSDFFTPGARLAFAKLRQVFVKALILHHFDPERYIQVETDTLGYTIGGALSQLTSDDLGQ